MKLPYSELWQDWLTDCREHRRAYVFPIYNPIENLWIVYSPGNEDFMEVPNEDYMKWHNNNVKFKTRYDERL